MSDYKYMPPERWVHTKQGLRWTVVHQEGKPFIFIRCNAEVCRKCGLTDGTEQVCDCKGPGKADRCYGTIVYSVNELFCYRTHNKKKYITSSCHICDDCKTEGYALQGSYKRIMKDLKRVLPGLELLTLG